MLNDADRRRLAEIERELRAQDPSFAQRLTSATPRSPAQWCGMGATGWLLTAAFTACLALLLQSGPVTVIALLAACLSMGLWAADDNSRR
ncbi:DUF3040 domain-containing protein [Actinoplanes sp. DH11]|uniref:DUF3040 domain-containing protein n=1 Tax=Actinoplanes sp. DH11 TaxID=2857011 RepID=UPI001E59B1C0|nr:DUF3040 domain-containing protein [Actinoplanes sp. DH11]